MASPAEAEPLTAVIEPLYLARNWMRFLALLLFVSGAMTAASIIGLVVAWLPILLGVFLWQAAAAVDAGHQHSDPERLRRGTSKLAHLFVTSSLAAVVVMAGFCVLLFLSLAAAIVESL